MSRTAITIYVRKDVKELLGAINPDPDRDLEEFAAELLGDGIEMLQEERARRERAAKGGDVDG